jgi:hypothetical protein
MSTESQPTAKPQPAAKPQSQFRRPLDCNATVTIDDVKLYAYTSVAGISALADGSGMPSMGTMSSTFEFSADVHNKEFVPFATVKKLFDLCNQPTQDKIKDIKMEFWSDDRHDDVIITISFKGWISSWSISGGGSRNHLLSVSIQPQLGQNQYLDIRLGN